MIHRACLVFVAAVLFAAPVFAQDLRGFVGAAANSDINGQHYASFGGGALIDVGTPWLSAGAQAEALVSWPYFAGRGALLAQGNVVPKGPVRPFVLAGVGIGEESGTLVGGGVEFRQRGTRYGWRLSVEDYVVRYKHYDGANFRDTTGHQLAFRGSLLF